MNTPNTRALALSAQVSLSIARANWWTAYAHSPENLECKIYRGGCGDTALFTRDELIDKAFKTANQHLMNAQEALESLNILSGESAQ